MMNRAEEKLICARRSVLAVLRCGLALLAIPTFAETPRTATGLLELPALRALVAAGKGVETFTLTVYAAPARTGKSRRIAAGEKPGQLLLKEHGYEEYSVVALERRTVGGQRWARVALTANSPEGSAWLPEPAAATFRSYADLVEQSLAFMTEAWDGRVWDSPGGVPRVIPRKQIQRPEQPADVFGYREVNGQLWLHVNIFSESPCEQQQPLSLVEGWVPAYGAHGEWMADFYPRGC